VLMVAATLFTGTLRQLRSTSPGLDTSNVLGMQLMNRPGGYRGMDPPPTIRTLRAIGAHPGVRSVSSASLPP